MYDDYLNAKVSQKKTDEFTVHRKGGWGSLDETTARLHLESEVNICQKNKKRMCIWKKTAHGSHIKRTYIIYVLKCAAPDKDTKISFNYWEKFGCIEFVEKKMYYT